MSVKDRRLVTIVTGKTADEIKRIAAEEERSVSAVQRRLLEEGLRRRSLESKKEGT